MTDIRDQIAAEIAAGHRYSTILADPPWHFQSWQTPRWNGDKKKKVLTPARAPDYKTMSVDEIAALPVADLAGPDSILFLWGIWVNLPEALKVISGWGFEYKTCAFNWIKADVSTVDMFDDPKGGQWGLGYWVRQNSEFCLLATRGKPKRQNADVPQSIIERRREHSRKPEIVHRRIERLVAGPYLELFGRTKRAGWTVLGNEVGKFAEVTT